MSIDFLNPKAELRWEKFCKGGDSSEFRGLRAET